MFGSSSTSWLEIVCTHTHTIVVVHYHLWLPLFYTCCYFTPMISNSYPSFILWTSRSLQTWMFSSLLSWSYEWDLIDQPKECQHFIFANLFSSALKLSYNKLSPIFCTSLDEVFPTNFHLTVIWQIVPNLYTSSDESWAVDCQCRAV